jgi:polyhydroxyalkanoate synthesis regulator phasin/predicted RNA-binding Zn-ribbon protein involved in translation (DUF1610 family)
MTEEPNPKDKLVQAYEEMLQRTHAAMEQAEKETVPALREFLDRARDSMVELGELTREEAAKVADYVERDIKEAAEYLTQTGADLRQWWRFDVSQVQERLLEMFSSVADQTSLQLQNWARQARQAVGYHTGEITGPGTLLCAACGAELQMHKPGHIPPCPKCHGTLFKRPAAGQPEGDQAGS